MPIAIDPKATIDYVLKCDEGKPTEDQTVYELRWLTVSELAQLEDGTLTSQMDADGKPEFRVLSGSVQVKALVLGLVGWRNFKDREGNEIKFKRRSDKCAKENLDFLHPSWRRELSEAITEMNEVTEEDEKNS